MTHPAASVPKSGLGLSPFHAFQDIASDALAYQLDFAQRMTLFLDTKCRQGDQFIEENRKGLPPVLHFDYEVIFDGRDLDEPVNYALARITPEEGSQIPADARPLVIIDPRAGHGPGIGGFRKESEVGLAMRKNHPVYFILFTQQPVRGQTLAQVFKAHIQFLKVVRMFHPEAEKPAIIGNCQGGWAAALIAADRPDITGPLILNGSPLSYWAGKDIQNPMRYRGGLFGGVWLASLSADLGNGIFDGAQLVSGFEDLNPANTLWKKDYNLWHDVDTEKERYLFFEKWWNGFVFMTKEEIRFVVRDLFVGNRLEEGKVTGGSGEVVNLKSLRDPIIIFASKGDNITPPEQALGWIERVWGSEEEIRKRGQVIIYLVHGKVGHLGIFVSRNVILREHNELIDSVDLAQYLAPGLYAMVLDDSGEARFESRRLESLGPSDEGADQMARPFENVRKASEMLEFCYDLWGSPLMKPLGNELTASALREGSPQRQRLYWGSSMNPVMAAAKAWAPWVAENRMEAPESNRFRRLEKAGSDMISASLDCWRDMRDMGFKYLFYTLYDNPLSHMVLQEAPDPAMTVPDLQTVTPVDGAEHWIARMTEGGFMAGLFRGLVALGSVKKVVDKSQLATMKAFMKGVRQVKAMTLESAREMIREQQALLGFNRELAIHSLPELINTPEERLTAIAIFQASLEGSQHVDPAAKLLLTHFEELLKDRKVL